MIGPIASKTEIIAFCSGKGGTGKTIIASCLGYGLCQSSHRVLMVDGDPGTDGLSLFLLGPQGMKEIDTFLPLNTFTGMLHTFTQSRSVEFQPRTINRGGSQDHGVVYEALISGKAIYGQQDTIVAPVVPGLDRQTFREAISAFFSQLRSGQEYDYVLVDTRGGFAFESTDICALAQSFVVVTEPDYTSFYQDRNLVRYISAAAQQLGARPFLRSIIVNKATEGQVRTGPLNLTEMEASFRLELTREFPLRFEDTHPVPMDIEAIQAYKRQQIPYRTAPASHFAFATLSAFGDILKVVTAAWSDDRIAKWNALVETTSQAIAQRNSEIERARQEETKEKQELADLRHLTQDQGHQIESLKRELDRVDKGYQREIERAATQIYAPRDPSREMQLDQDVKIPKNFPLKPKKGSSSPAVSSIEPAMISSPPKGSIFRSVIAIVVTAIVTIAVLAGIYTLTKRPESTKDNLSVAKSSESQRDDLLAKIYSPLPPALKVSYLEQLSSQGWRVFDKIDLSGVTLDRLNLQGDSFRSADFSRASLRDANLAGAHLSGADLTQADLSGANMRGANLKDAKVTRAQLVSALTDEQTILTDGQYGPAGAPPPPPPTDLRQKGLEAGREIAYYREAIRLKPDNALAHYRLGNALHDADDWDGAIAEYREAVRLKPDWAEAHYKLGRLFANKGDRASAVDEYSAAYRLAPDNSKYRAAYEKLKLLR